MTSPTSRYSVSFWIAAAFGIIASAWVLFNRYQSSGAFLPWTCSLFDLACPSTVSIIGHANDRYSAAKARFEENFLEGYDIGAGVAAYVNGELVLDLQGGWQNFEESIPFTENTLVPVYSCTKMVSAIVIAKFVQKGLLSYDEPITRYWPEFGQGNKQNVTVGDLMQHAAGVGSFDKPLSLADALDVEKFSDILASQVHNFGGERTRAYHAMTQGWYQNEILKRVSGQTIGGYVKENFPVYDIEWNLSPYESSYDARLVRLYRAPKPMRIIRLAKLMLDTSGASDRLLALLMKSTSTQGTINTSPDQLEYYQFIQPEVRRLEGPSYSGFTNARSMAKLGAMMANGGKAIRSGEPDLLDEATFAVVTEPVPLDFDTFIGIPTPALKGGFGISDKMVAENVTFVGWSGAGGSAFYWNEEYKIGFGYCTNSLGLHTPDHRSLSILSKIVQAAKASKLSA
ncbi:hypothetical protein DFQ28_009213 [Apophysomyces sp. BC1034]|nr:hypothetical protein DFQ30_008731 [Apophysomyces sp. BC1015]KAG0173830.1 hypothetical protein DFQ29_007740 [Apophysomyces sp. BC1021]KAG0185511.1 hypothetical protein DFQ28_009213 [Apophysomyces sp. BC1034]